MNIRILILITMLTTPNSVLAVIPASTLLQGCEGNKSEQDMCASYIGGVLAGIKFVEEATNREKKICLPSDMGWRQLREVFIKYSYNTPENLHYSAAGNIFGAISQAFPCE